MINNRQTGRRRGRGGPRSPNAIPSQGNRQDNRSRGNAAQLHEKYKAMARDTQLAGDRVQTEYFLQFADHYYRVLSESRARYEEQRRQRDDYGADEDDGEEYEAAEERQDRPERQERGDRYDRGDRAERGDRGPRHGRRDERQDESGEPHQREDRAEQQPGEDHREARPRRGKPRRPREDEANGEERISLDSLPPAISAEPGDEAPRRRTRRVRTGDEGDTAPAG